MKFKLQAPINEYVASSEFKLGAKDAKDGEPAELLVMDDIGESWYGDGITDKEVAGFQKANAGQPIKVRINSFGGDAYQGLAMFNILSSHDADVTTIVEGVAYSAASAIFMSGKNRQMFEASDLGIHRASVGAIGNQNTYRAMTEWLATLDSHLLDIYGAFTGADDSQLNAWIDGTDGVLGTVFPASDALSHGFATEMIPIAGKESEPAASAKRVVSASFRQRMSAQRGMARA